ncbi:unnamed protein product [Ranitomeya imitator]|uniref:Uncharacterized protein n=1 Tax=Ranitomeya imitator TaxID=111125 RepID=A0ABN9LK82_9NEOB|nr:unnamed protein product [Ranitomeya imitator]
MRPHRNTCSRTLRSSVPGAVPIIVVRDSSESRAMSAQGHHDIPFKCDRTWYRVPHCPDYRTSKFSWR